MAARERIVVVGTGPAGASAAHFLCRAGFEPLVLEAGSEDARLGFTARARGITIAKSKPALLRRSDLTQVGDPSAELYEELAPGGLSNHWACAVPRFSAEDFADARRAGALHTWPVDYLDLVPWYDRVEPLLEIAGSAYDVARLPAGRVKNERELSPVWDPVAREAGRCGRSVVAMPYAYGASTTLTRAATPFNAYMRLLKPLEDAGRLDVRYRAQALALVWSAKERRVTHVRVRGTRTGAVDEIPCRAVLLAAGAVNSAQILLESASADFPSGLGNEHGVLGRYLHDHPLAKLVLELDRPVPIHPASYITRPALEGQAPLYAAAFMQWAGVFALARSALSGRFGESRTIGFSVFGTMVPTPNDRVELDRSRPALGRSALQMSLRYPAEAVAVLERARDELVDCMAKAGWSPRIKSFRLEVPGNSVHYGGTCRMHESPRFGVVDRFCRVHGVRNVAVADSAAFTTGPEKNPVLTAMALAARAAARLGDEISAGDL
jgi:choline dehydrogenase-like flavoprotein